MSTTLEHVTVSGPAGSDLPATRENVRQQVAAVVASVRPQGDSDEATQRRRQLAELVVPPSDDAFGDEDFLDSPEMARLGDQLIADWPELHHITQTRVSYSWKRRGGSRSGKPTAARCVALSGLARHFGEADFAVWIASDHLRDQALGPGQIEALVYAELCHIGQAIDQDESSPTYGEVKIKLVGHDFEGFWSEVTRYPGWRDELRQTENTFQQARLNLNAAGDSSL